MLVDLLSNLYQADHPTREADETRRRHIVPSLPAGMEMVRFSISPLSLLYPLLSKLDVWEED